MKIAAPSFEFIAKSLRQCPGFSILSDSEISQLASSTVAAKLSPGEVIYRRGDPAVGFYLVWTGAVRLVTDDNPEESSSVSGKVLGPGKCFGELDVLEDSTRAATAMALDGLSVVAFDRADFEMILIQSPDLLRHILDSLDAHIGERGTSVNGRPE